MHEVSLTFKAGGHQGSCTCGWVSAVRSDKALAMQETKDHVLLYADLSAEQLAALFGQTGQ